MNPLGKEVMTRWHPTKRIGRENSYLRFTTTYTNTQTLSYVVRTPTAYNSWPALIATAFIQDYYSRTPACMWDVAPAVAAN